ncbi:hypothetical protein [Kordia sp.]|uniref:hypothetical protein n=1 Tax=Kordia sp. TaxID=1965332 RepID=UPI003D29F19E
MKLKTALLTLLTLLLFIVSCQTYRVTPTTTEKYQPTNPSNVELFITNKPTKKYKEIGTVSVRTVNSYGVIATTRSAEKANNMMREKAASIGGHAVINYKEEEQQIKGIVIRYTEE